MVDLEFVQFHPTALVTEADPLPLMTEALRGDGAVLVDETGKAICDSLAPRDVVARALFRHAGEGHQTLLDLRPVVNLEKRFPSAVRAARKAGFVMGVPGKEMFVGSGVWDMSPKVDAFNYSDGAPPAHVAIPA